MRFVIFGLTVSSSWGNGHATLWRSLIKAMLQRGHTVLFYEKDVPYYSGLRDLWELPSGGELRLYTNFKEIRCAALAMADADVVLCTSFCPDGVQACDLVLDSSAPVKAFYDLDTPVTLNGISIGKPVAYLPVQGLKDFDVVLSYTGGRALGELKDKLGARIVAPLYGSVDPETRTTQGQVGTTVADFGCRCTPYQQIAEDKTNEHVPTHVRQAVRQRLTRIQGSPERETWEQVR